MMHSLTNELLNSPWTQLKMVVLDLEGTGAQHKANEGIVEIAAVIIEHGQLSGDTFSQRLNPEIEIPRFISRIHGIRNEDVKECPRFDDIKLSLLDFLGANVIVAHNAHVEWRVLRQKLPNYRPPALLDSLKLSRRLYQNAPKHGLDELIVRLDLASELKNCVPDNVSRHNALFDASATALAFIRMLTSEVGAEHSLSQIVELCGISLIESSKAITDDGEQQFTLF